MAKTETRRRTMALLAPKPNNLKHDPTLLNLKSTLSDLQSLLTSSQTTESNLIAMDTKFDLLESSLSNASRKITPLQSLAMSRKALETRINRAISPALALLNTFRLAESLQRTLLDVSKEVAERTAPQQQQGRRLRKILEYADCVDRLNEAIDSICEVGEGVILKLQEVVEFISRTKAADQYRTQRLREALVTLKALYETEVDEMRFEGLLDQALLHLQDEFEALLLNMKHRNLGNMSSLLLQHEYDIDDNDSDDHEHVKVVCELGTEMEIEVLRRIATTLAANDCLDICIDIYVKARYRRAAKALMKLNPDYLRTYTPEGIDEMEWENLESSITLWIQHFQVAVKNVLLSEKALCQNILDSIMDGLVWPECFVKISDKIMAVFFRFGEGVARSSKEPQKLFKLLDMFESLEKLKPQVLETFEGESGVDICTRFRELEKLIIDASSKVFWEFGLQIEGNADGLPPPQDGSVPKLVRYAINYLKYLSSKNYRASMAKVLRTEQAWKNGILSKQETDESILRDAMCSVMEALERNMESKRSRCRDKVLGHVMLMNTYWYIYMRTKNTELGELLGDQYMRVGYKGVAEECAYLYQKQAWGFLVGILEGEDAMGGSVTEKMEGFFKCFDEVCERHARGPYSIPDFDLREQMREATARLLVPPYAQFLDSYSGAGLLQKEAYPSPERLQGLVRKAFDGGDVKMRRRGSASGRNSASMEAADIGHFRRSRPDHARAV